MMGAAIETTSVIDNRIGRSTSCLAPTFDICRFGNHCRLTLSAKRLARFSTMFFLGFTLRFSRHLAQAFRQHASQRALAPQLSRWPRFQSPVSDSLIEPLATCLWTVGWFRVSQDSRPNGRSASRRRPSMDQYSRRSADREHAQLAPALYA